MYLYRWRVRPGMAWMRMEVSLSRLWKTRLFCHTTIASMSTPIDST
jgi:hypothetical protein